MLSRGQSWWAGHCNHGGVVVRWLLWGLLLAPMLALGQVTINSLPAASTQTGNEILPEYQAGSCSSTQGTCGVTTAMLAAYAITLIPGNALTITQPWNFTDGLEANGITVLEANYSAVVATWSGCSVSPSALYLRADGTCDSPSGSGTVTSVSVATANGFAGTVANPTSTPAISIEPNFTGIAYCTSGTSCGAAVAADFPTLNQSTTGNAATATSATSATTASTATALASTPAQCGANEYATGVTAAGAANCSAPPYESYAVIDIVSSSSCSIESYANRNIASCASTSDESANVSFSTAYSAAPTCVATLEGVAGAGDDGASWSSSSTTEVGVAAGTPDPVISVVCFGTIS